MKNNGSLLILFVFLLSAHTLTAPQAHAGGYHNGTYYGGGELGDVSPFQEMYWFLFGFHPDKTEPVQGHSVVEANAPDPKKCNGGYRWEQDKHGAYSRIFC